MRSWGLKVFLQKKVTASLGAVAHPATAPEPPRNRHRTAVSRARSDLVQVGCVASYCAAMPRPRRYPRVCAEDRRRIIDAYKDGRDYAIVAQELGVRRTTAWSIVAKWQRTGEVTVRPRGGNRPEKIDNETRDLLLMVVEPDPTITLQRLNNLLRETWPDKPQVSNPTISRALHNCLISVKQTRNIQANRNSPGTKEKRHE